MPLNVETLQYSQTPSKEFQQQQQQQQHNNNNNNNDLVRTTQVSRYQKKHSPTHHPDHHPIFISFFHLPRSIESSLFKLRAWQSFWHNRFPCPLKEFQTQEKTAQNANRTSLVQVQRMTILRSFIMHAGMPQRSEMLSSHLFPDTADTTNSTVDRYQSSNTDESHTIQTFSVHAPIQPNP